MLFKDAVSTAEFSYI